MRSTRLEMALQSGSFAVPPTGLIAVIRPRAGDDLSALPKDRVVVLTGFKPDADYFAAQGYASKIEGPVSMALLCLPKAKAAARGLIAKVGLELVPNGLLVLDGQKTDGIDSILKDCKALGLEVGPALSKAHGKIAVVTPSDALAEWVASAWQIEDGFVTLPGVFSAEGPDRASVLLAAALPPKLPPAVADFGAGWGYLSRAILARQGVSSLDLIEAEADALDCARVNITDPRARFHWADATTIRPAKLWDAVVMNPPFHNGREADPGLGIAFIKAAQKVLAPGGSLWLVCNRHLPYEAELKQLFKRVDEQTGDASFRIYHASVPQRTR